MTTGGMCVVPLVHTAHDHSMQLYDHPINLLSLANFVITQYKIMPFLIHKQQVFICMIILCIFPEKMCYVLYIILLIYHFWCLILSSCLES